MADQFSPPDWLVSGFAALTDYISSEINAAVKDNANANAGLQAYELVMDYPTSDTLPKAAEFTKTIIHLAIDDIDNKRLGFGDSRTTAEIVEAVGANPATITEHEGQAHEINFDVGVWASDKSGGTSSRLRAYQMLHQSLGTEIGKQKCFESTGGVEIRRFNNGRFLIEKPNDIRLFRVAGAELVVRVYSSHIAVPLVIVDKEPDQQPNVEIGSVPVVT